MLCDYGCGKEATYQFKNGKWCCSKDCKQCSEQRKKNSKSCKGREAWNKGKSPSEETRKKLSELRKKITGVNHPLYGKPCSEERRKKISESNKKWNLEHDAIWLGKKHTEESKKKIGLKSLGRKHDVEFKNRWRARLLNGDSKKMNSIPRNPEKIKKFKEDRRNWMLENGRYVRSKIKKISNEELNLRNMIKELYPECEFQYPVFKYSIDVAIPKYKIAIEYDGYYHFCNEEMKQYHKLRQEKIETQGWKFYRVTMFDKFPNLEEVKKSIEKIIKGEKNETISER